MKNGAISCDSFINDEECQEYNHDIDNTVSYSLEGIISVINEAKSELGDRISELSKILVLEFNKEISSDGIDDHLSFVRSEIRETARRSSLFPKVMAGDPAWSILLDLFEAKLTGKSRAIKSACLASGVPATTALRYLDLLVSEGYVERSLDPVDGRRVLVSLTSLANDRMVNFFTSRK